MAENGSSTGGTRPAPDLSDPALLHIEGLIPWPAGEGARKLGTGSSLYSAIVLAAGKSERMGRPKALLPFRGRTFLENIMDAIARSSIQHSLVVVGHHRAEIASRLQLAEFDFQSRLRTGHDHVVPDRHPGPPGRLYRRAAFSRRPSAGRCRDDQSCSLANFAAGRIMVPVFKDGAGIRCFFRPKYSRKYLLCLRRKGLISWYERILDAL